MIQQKLNLGWLGFLGFLSFNYLETGNPLHLIPFGCFTFFLFFIDDLKIKRKKSIF